MLSIFRKNRIINDVRKCGFRLYCRSSHTSSFGTSDGLATPGSKGVPDVNTTNLIGQNSISDVKDSRQSHNGVDTNNNDGVRSDDNNDFTLVRRLQTQIKLSGPITIADYMNQVLTDPVAGYYMKKDVFGKKGDFITSPEISQMFGELIGIWCVNEWMRCGQPAPFRVVELGPGRGTLADDMLRVFSKFNIKNCVQLSLVEISPKLKTIQQQKLCNYTQTSSSSPTTLTSIHGVPVTWYPSLTSVPEDVISFYVGHEFLDALPVHKFQKRNNKWSEILVDNDSDDPQGNPRLRYILSERETVTSKVLLKVHAKDSRQHIELCPQAGVIVEEISSRIRNHGGFAMFADYGHSGEKGDTFRAFKDHKLHDPLCMPGSADLTADVDFSYLKSIARDKVKCYGPVNQNAFLSQMGIQQRLTTLMNHSSEQIADTLISQYETLMRDDRMGARFKFLAILDAKTIDANSNTYVPAGFNTTPVAR